MLSDSSSASEKFSNDAVDMIYIDGDHTYDGVVRDLTKWFFKIKVGGYICGHDFLVVRNSDTKSSELRDYWDNYSAKSDSVIIEKLGVKMVAKNEVARAIIDTLGIPDWWDTQNPPNTVGSNWYFKKTPELKLKKVAITETEKKVSAKVEHNYVSVF